MLDSLLSIGGSLLDGHSDKRANLYNMRSDAVKFGEAIRQFNVGQNFAQDQSDLQQKNFLKNFKYQDLVNKNSMQWRAEDAKKAGFHPLYAMGGQTLSASLATPNAVSGGGSPGIPGSHVKQGNSKWANIAQQYQTAAAGS